MLRLRTWSNQAPITPRSLQRASLHPLPSFLHSVEFKPNNDAEKPDTKLSLVSEPEVNSTAEQLSELTFVDGT